MVFKEQIHMPYPHNIVRIDLSSLAFNLGQVKRLVGPEVRIMGIVKSDAYGHGMVEISRTLEKYGVYALGTASLREAMILRENGIKRPIVILSGIKSREEADAAVENTLTPAVFDLPSARVLAEAAEKRAKRACVQVKIDTGMGRLGVRHQDAMAFLKEITRSSWLHVDGILSHLSSADEEDRAFTKKQIEIFGKILDAAREEGYDLRLNTLANSAGIMGYKGSHFDMVRPGIMLYGGLPSPGYSPPVELRPVMSLTGRIIQIREMPADTPLSYSRRYITDRMKRIAIVSAGYGDGIPRGLTNKGKVIIGGQRADILGAVCMNLTLCDITDIKDARLYDEAVFLGGQGSEIITGDDMAAWNNTISYEIFLSIGKGAEREYTE
jgi:alanine racemase